MVQAAPAPAPVALDDLLGGIDERRAMVVMAHPDDCEFACGGAVALLCRAGWEVDIVVATSGSKGTRDTKLTSQQLAATREEEQRAAARILGAREPVFFGFGDGELPEDDELRGLIVRQIRLRRPSLVITWDGYRQGFNHRDHRRVGRSVYDAIYPAAGDHLYYPRHGEEGLKPHRPRMMLLAGTDQPDVQLDIRPVLRRKLRAVFAHASQIGARSEQQLLRMWRERARQQGGGGRDPVVVESYRRVDWPR